MKHLKSPIFGIIVNFISILISFLCLMFFGFSMTTFIVILICAILYVFTFIVNLYHKNFKYILLNILILGFIVFVILEALNDIDRAITRMYQPYGNIQNGDIIFQTSTSSQSLAIQAATNSKYSHMGIIYEYDNQHMVYEASSTVKLTPLNEWVNNGLDGKFVVKRIKDSDNILTPDVLKKMKNVGEGFKGKRYDKYFNWSDQEIYCSELVWKIYKKAANIELGKLENLSNFDLTSKEVQNKLNERYNGKIPYNELVISPANIFNSDKLEIVEEN